MAATAEVLRFRVDGVVYTFNPEDITPAVERQMLIESGVTPQQALRALDGGAFFAVAALVWLARKQRGDKVAYLAVESQLEQARKEAGEDFDLEILTGEVDPPPPV